MKQLPDVSPQDSHSKLSILKDFNDSDSAAIVIRNLARLWRASNDANLIARLASVLEMTPEEATSLLQKWLDALSEQPEAYWIRASIICSSSSMYETYSG